MIASQGRWRLSQLVTTENNVAIGVFRERKVTICVYWEGQQ